MIKTPCGIEIPEYPLKPEYILNRSIILYGKSNSGKSTVIKHIVSTVQSYISSLFVVSPTEPANNAYGEFLPKALIHYNLDKDANGKTFLDKFLDWQEARTSVYKRVSDLKTLRRIYEKNPNPTTDSTINKIRNAMSASTDPKQLKQCEEILIKIYKRYIKENKSKYNSMNLDVDDTYIVKYINTNPYSVIIFDDCAAAFKKEFRSEIFRKLFYQGRHLYVTMLLSCQDNTDLDANLRKNAGINIFTQPSVVKTNFELKSNGYDKPTVSKVNKIIPTIFQGYRKLIYLDNDPSLQHFYHYTASRNDIKINPCIKELCKNVENKDSNINSTNVYLNHFKN